MQIRDWACFGPTHFWGVIFGAFVYSPCSPPPCLRNIREPSPCNWRRCGENERGKVAENCCCCLRHFAVSFPFCPHFVFPSSAGGVSSWGDSLLCLWFWIAFWAARTKLLAIWERIQFGWLPRRGHDGGHGGRGRGQDDGGRGRGGRDGDVHVAVLGLQAVNLHKFGLRSEMQKWRSFQLSRYVVMSSDKHYAFSWHENQFQIKSIKSEHYSRLAKHFVRIDHNEMF